MHQALLGTKLLLCVACASMVPAVHTPFSRAGLVPLLGYATHRLWQPLAEPLMTKLFNAAVTGPGVHQHVWLVLLPTAVHFACVCALCFVLMGLVPWTLAPGSSSPASRRDRGSSSSKQPSNSRLLARPSWQLGSRAASTEAWVALREGARHVATIPAWRGAGFSLLLFAVGLLALPYLFGDVPRLHAHLVQRQHIAGKRSMPTGSMHAYQLAAPNFSSERIRHLFDECRWAEPSFGDGSAFLQWYREGTSCSTAVDSSLLAALNGAAINATNSSAGSSVSPSTLTVTLAAALDAAPNAAALAASLDSAFVRALDAAVVDVEARRNSPWAQLVRTATTRAAPMIPAQSSAPSDEEADTASSNRESHRAQHHPKQQPHQHKLKHELNATSAVPSAVAPLAATQAAVVQAPARAASPAAHASPPLEEAVQPLRSLQASTAKASAPLARVARKPTPPGLCPILSPPQLPARFANRSVLLIGDSIDVMTFEAMCANFGAPEASYLPDVVMENMGDSKCARRALSCADQAGPPMRAP